MAFRVGERVVHPKFGPGLVLLVNGKDDAITYRVSFEEDGEQRNLLARIANLELSPDQPTKATKATKSRAKGAKA
jgi:hypothetical protein